MRAERHARLRCALAALAALALTGLAGDPEYTDVRARLRALAAEQGHAPLRAEAMTAARMPRAAFERGEAVGLSLESQRAGQLFGVLVDSHGVATLLGEGGWLGTLADPGEHFTLALGKAHWETGLPLGSAEFFVFVVPRSGVSLIDDATGAVEGGVLSAPAAGRLVDALEALGSDTPRGRIEVGFVHAARVAVRGLGVSAPPPAPLVRREEIVAYFTGARTRAVKRERLDLYIPFDFDQSELDAAARRQVDELAHALRDQRIQGLSFVLAGHTDRRGARDYNLELSRRRAAAVRKALVVEHGIEPARLATEGYGFEQPLDPDDDERAHAVNRRVDLRVGAR